MFLSGVSFPKLVSAGHNWCRLPFYSVSFRCLTDGEGAPQCHSSDSTTEVQESVTPSSSQHTTARGSASSPRQSLSPSKQPASEHDQVFDATKWMVHALMAPATTDSFGHLMWGHVLGCCDSSATCASGLNCQNVKSTMRHLLQCQV